MVRFEIIKDLDKAQELWELLTPRETIYDEWEFRYSFYKYTPTELFFYTGYEDGNLIGLLPLEYSVDHKCLAFFGTDYMEDNRVLIKPGFEQYIPEFYKAVQKSGLNYKLEYIRGDDPFTKSFPLADYKYILPLEGLTSYEDYLAKNFEGKNLREFKRKVRTIAERHTIEIKMNNFIDIEQLFEYNIIRFPDRSMFKRPFRKDIFRELPELSISKPYIASYIVDGTLQAISYSLIYKDTLESFNTGIAPTAPKNLREYIYLKKIDEAIKMGLKTFDSFIRSYGWKEEWKFHKIPQYIFPES